MSASPAAMLGRDRAPRRLSRPTAFVAVASTLVVFLAASSAPSPLYVVYQQRWHFSAIALTVVFAVYVLGMLASLLVLGALSDHLGRRPVLAAALGLQAVALVLFLVAGDVFVLGVARLLQGVATGAAVTTLGAALVDLAPPHAPARAGLVNGATPIAGLALGALGCGVLAEYAPAPTRLVYLVLLAGTVLCALAVAAMPETSARVPGARASLVPRLGVPSHARAGFAALAPIMIASWALGGLYLSLGPSVASDTLGLSSRLTGGLVVTALCGTGAVTVVALRGRTAREVARLGPGLLAAGTAVTLTAIVTDSTGAAVVGTLVSGTGFGASALAMFGTLAQLARPAERGGLFAVGYTVAYLAFSVPAVLAGVATSTVGLRPTALAYGFTVVLLGLTACVIQAVQARTHDGARSR